MVTDMPKSDIKAAGLTFEHMVTASEVCRLLNYSKFGVDLRKNLDIEMYDWFFDPDFDLECTKH
jgi:hypothetical protein